MYDNFTGSMTLLAPELKITLFGEIQNTSPSFIAFSKSTSTKTVAELLAPIFFRRYKLNFLSLKCPDNYR